MSSAELARTEQNGEAPGAAAQGQPRTPAVYARGLSKTYRGSRAALTSLDLEVGQGEVFGFLGPNGAGKTTAVKLLLGLARPSSGEALVLGEPIGDVEVRRRIGYLPEMFRYQPWLSATEVIGYHCRLLGFPAASRSEEALRVLARVGLAERAHDRVSRFSKGMQQRLGLAVALTGSPEIVFLDEPTSALDPLGRHEVRAIISDLRDTGVTVFLNTHLLDEAQHVCDRVAVIDQGHTLAIGPLSELLGSQTKIRVQVSGLSGQDWANLDSFGPWNHDGGWAETSSVGVDTVPRLVEALVAAGGQVHAVVPAGLNLEERFLQLLGQS